MIYLYTHLHMQRAILTVDTNDNNATDNSVMTNRVTSSHVSRMVGR